MALFGIKLPNYRQMSVGSSDPSIPSFDPHFGMPADAQTQMEAINATPAPKKSGLFGQDSALWKVLGTVGDAMSAANGVAPTYGPAMQQQRLHQQTMAEKQADRQAQYQQEMDLARFKATLPVNNDTVADYNFRVQTLGKDAADQWLRNAGDPIVTVQLPGNRIYSGPRSGMAAALAGGAAPATITADQWDSGTPVGGAGSNAGSGFRP